MLSRSLELHHQGSCSSHTMHSTFLCDSQPEYSNYSMNETLEKAEKVFSGENRAAFLELWAKAIPLTVVTLFTLFANGTIVLMFITSRSLWKCKNIYIASLAMADLLFGCTLPLTVYETLVNEWTFSRGMCIGYLTLRHSFLHISLLSILLISVDKWMSINHPFHYRVRRSRRKAAIHVCVAWFVGIFIHVGTIVGWELFSRRQRNDSLCRPSNDNSTSFMIPSSVVLFFLPLMVLWILNVHIYVRIRHRKRSKIRRSISTADGTYVNFRKSSSDLESLEETASLYRANSVLQIGRRSSITHAPKPSLSLQKVRRNSYAGLHLYSNRQCNGPGVPSSRMRSRRPSVESLTALTPFPGNNTRRPSLRSSKTQLLAKPTGDDLMRDFLSKQDKKAACCLSLLVVIFTVCWTPEMILSLFVDSCKPTIPRWLLMGSYWLLAANSAVNPFLYGIGNAEFRNVFKSWMHCRKRTFSRYVFDDVFQGFNLETLGEIGGDDDDSTESPILCETL